MPPYPLPRRSASAGSGFHAPLVAAISNQSHSPPERATCPALMIRGVVRKPPACVAAIVNESRTDWLTGSVNENCAGCEEIVTARVPLASSAKSVIPAVESTFDQVEG